MFCRVAWQRWSVAWERALYGPNGFYVRPDVPARHFRTSAHAGDALARLVLGLLSDVDDGLSHPTELDVVDVGAGGGELLTRLLALADDSLRARLVMTGVDFAPRPADLPAQVRWSAEVPRGVLGLLIGNEWLDNVPCHVVARDDTGRLRELEVEVETGAERLGRSAVVGDDTWCSLWWHLDAGQRAEVGRDRDRAWAQALTRIDFGCAVAVDYAHSRGSRRPTLTGYRGGRQVPPVPDGSCDITAHVALDSCASAGEDVTGQPPLLVSQRDILHAYEMTGSLPPVELAAKNPGAYAAELQRASDEAELLNADGLGEFSWLVQPVGMPMPARLAALR
jgi:SAM-dependent MidA family methyltransferase